MSMLRREQTVCTRGVAALAVLAAVTLAGCATGEKARREAEMAALVKQVEELKKGQDQMTREVGRLAGELKALDAQAAFLVGETKASAQEREQLKATFQQQDKALTALRSGLDETNQKVATLSVPPPAPVAPKPSLPTATKEATPEKLFATAMTSFRAEEHGQAVLEFTQLIDKFPKHALAPTSQLLIGEAYHRHRSFNPAPTEFQEMPELYPHSQSGPESVPKLG